MNVFDKMMKRSLIATLLMTLLCACTSASDKRLKVIASAVPHAEMLEFIQPQLKKEGIDLFIIVTDDYQMPNRAVADKEADANFFQHEPFLQQQVRQLDYPLVAIAKVELEPMGVYSQKLRTLSDLGQGALVAIPNDPTNEGRALLLLQEQGLIRLDQTDALMASVVNIQENPYRLQFQEMDAAMLPRTLQDVDAAVINTNYALQAGLSPQNALALESKDSPYANVLVVRKEDQERADILTLKKALTSEEMRQFLWRKYQGSVIPAF